MENNALLARIESAYVEGTRTKNGLIKSGPFLISLNPTTRLRWLNNALVDDDSVAIESKHVQEMARVFEEHDRIPRMELFKELRPDLVATLIGEGFEIESELPTMVCTPATFVRQTSPNVEVEIMTPDSDLAPFMRVVDKSFGHEEPISAERLEGMRQSLRKGSQWAAMAMIDGAPAAVASLVVSDSVAELAGVGTLPDSRRRGAASTVSTRLLEEFFQQGDIAWLSAGDDTAQAVYERLGFKLIGVQVNISKPEQD